MRSMHDISVVITGHREGIVAGATVRSAMDAISVAKASGAKVEIIVVLDRTNDSTREIFQSALGAKATILETDHGDPGLARNSGIEVANGKFSTFLDADDLWSENWLSSAWEAAQRRPDAVWHSHCNIVFGNERNFWWHIDSEGSLFDADYLSWANYWDAMSFASTSIYRETPFRANNLSAGFGHEDWHWNVQTIGKGIAHKPVYETVHFKRRRTNSQMAAVFKSDAVIWPQ